jgi:hypothetical protein
MVLFTGCFKYFKLIKMDFISEGTKNLKLVISAVSTRAIVSTVMEQDIILDITNLESSDSYVTED